MIGTIEETVILKKHNRSGVYTVLLHSNNIVELYWDKELKEIEKSYLQEIKQIIRDFGNGQKMRVYISIIDFLSITSEGREYSASVEGQEFTLANAVLIDNLAKKLAFNFFMNINQPKTPTKAFKTKEQAFDWLLERNAL